jgi:D-threo-aldose 1-dehydrogenase
MPFLRSMSNDGFISGSQRYNYGKENYKIPQPIIEKREKLREVSGRHGVDLRTAALQFSAEGKCRRLPTRAIG